MEPGAGTEGGACDAAYPTLPPPGAAEEGLAAADPNTDAEASADDEFVAGPPSSTPSHATAEAVRLIQERCEEYVNRQCGAWEPKELFEDGGIIPRLQATIEQLVDREGEKKVYRMPDGQTCEKIRELFKRTDPKTKKQEPGRLCRSFGYDTYLNHSKVLQLKELMPHLFAEIKAGLHPEHDAWAQAKRIVKAKKASAVAAPANVQRKRSMFQVTQEMLLRMDEIGPQHHRSEALTVMATFYQDKNADGCWADSPIRPAQRLGVGQGGGRGAGGGSGGVGGWGRARGPRSRGGWERVWAPRPLPLSIAVEGVQAD